MSPVSPRSTPVTFLVQFRGIVKKTKGSLAGVAQWIERRPANPRFTGGIPSQGTCLGCRPGPQQGASEKQPHIDVSLTLFPFPSL